MNLSLTHPCRYHIMHRTITEIHIKQTLSLHHFAIIYFSLEYIKWYRVHVVFLLDKANSRFYVRQGRTQAGLPSVRATLFLVQKTNRL
jgi:hypothetical protein